MKCPYCEEDAKLVTGKEIYPHRRDLWSNKIWLCEPCDAYVGCHKRSKQFPTGEEPLGRLANKELRKAKMAAHAVFDPTWKSKVISRSSAYNLLARDLGIEVKDCHIGMFDVDMCKKVIELCK